MSIDEQPDLILQVFRRFISNIKRIGYLVDVSTDLRESRDLDTFKFYTDEVFRAAVVLLHASFEDCLREITRLSLSDYDEETLDTIPLVGESRTGQPKKFSLGALNKHREKTVRQLIRESVSEFLDRMSFNSTTDIAYMLEKLNVELSDLRIHFSEIDEMISRRHQIVHRADLIGSPGHEEVAGIEGQEIVKWLSTVLAFIRNLTMQLGFSSDIYTLKQQLELQKEIVELQILLLTEARSISGKIFAQSRWLLERKVTVLQTEKDVLEPKSEWAEIKRQSVSLRNALKGKMDPGEIDIEFAKKIAEKLSEHFGAYVDALDLQNIL